MDRAEEQSFAAIRAILRETAERQAAAEASFLARMSAAEARMDRFEERMAASEAAFHARMDRAEQRMDRAEQRMDRAETRMDRAETRMDRAETRMDRAEERINRLDARFEKRMRGFEKLVLFGMKEMGNLRRMQRETDHKMNALIDSQQRTDATLRTLMHSLRRGGNGAGRSR